MHRKRQSGGVGIIYEVADADSYVVKQIDGVPTPMSVATYEREFKGDAFENRTDI